LNPSTLNPNPTPQVNEKIKMHSTYTSEAYAAEEVARAECAKAQTQCVAAIEQLRKQLDEVTLNPKP